MPSRSIFFVVLYLCALVWSKPLNTSKTLTRIAYGSCNKHDVENTLWDHIVDFQPDLWVWLGDVVYADTRVFPFVWVPSSLETVKAKFDAQLTVPGYQRLLNQTPVVGVWDDHDYGKNNGDRTFEMKAKVQEIFLDFVGEEPDSPRRLQEGIHAAYTFGPVGKRVKVILLDVRTFRDPRRTGPNIDILGETQWKWLEQELKHNDAQVTVIGSGTQVLPDDRMQVESWGDYPASRARFLQLLRDTKSSGVVLLSGDVHFAEILRHDCTGLGYPLYEFTSSGMTHSCLSMFPFGLCEVLLPAVIPNTYAASSRYYSTNYGTITIDWEAKPVRVVFQMWGEGGIPVLEQELQVTDLQYQSNKHQQMLGCHNSTYSEILMQHFRSRLTDPDTWFHLPLMLLIVVGIFFFALSCCCRNINKAFRPKQD
eukprot:GILK01008275.1.p1 GENE.GILK01008275.1~~GILK01008275.1.p1  ORF type:complete len:423 (-),score=39.30 GILK01008275.1:95-1363(-)